MFGSKEKETRPTTNLDTWIGPRITIEGNIHFSGGMRIDGTVRGTLTADDDKESVLTLSDKGTIEGEARAPHVEINGTFRGDIVASERIKLGALARVTGNIYYKILEMAAGAEVSGQIVRQEDPRRQLAAPAPVVAEARIEAKVDAKLDAPQPDFRLDGKPEAKADGKIDPKAEARLEAKVEPKDKSKLEAKRA
jgi:cytoskeletal protein CcmA (bactofilin family)